MGDESENIDFITSKDKRDKIYIDLTALDAAARLATFEVVIARRVRAR